MTGGRWWCLAGGLDWGNGGGGVQGGGDCRDWMGLKKGKRVNTGKI